MGGNGTGGGGGGGTVLTYTGPNTPTTNGSPVQTLDKLATSTTTTTKTQSTASNLAKYAPLPRSMAKMSERNLFVETTTTTTTLNPVLQIVPSSRISDVHHLNLVHPANYHQQIDHQEPQQLKGPVESNKVYRKSPFLPRKKELSEGKPSLPKKESKLTSIGEDYLRNFFLQ